MKPHILLLAHAMLATVTASPLSSSDTPQPAVALPGGPAAWKLVWQEEFDGGDPELDARWDAQNGPSYHIDCSRWRENVTVRDGTLRLTNRKESRAGQEWTSGSIWTKERFTYGYFEARYRYAAAPGTNNSFWLMTNTPGEPEKGNRFEIDINEGRYPNWVNTNIHNHSASAVTTKPDGKKTHPQWPKNHPIKKDGQPVDLTAEFHTYSALWTPDEIIFYFDGKEIRRERNEFSHSPTPVWLSLAIAKWAGPLTDAIDGTQMEVDYVRVWQQAGQESASSENNQSTAPTTKL